MAEAYQELFPQSVCRNNSNNRHNQHSDHSQFNSGLRRSVPSCDGNSFSINRRQNCSSLYPKGGDTDVIREPGLILEVQRDYGRIISRSNFTRPYIHFYFSLSTLVNDVPLNAITDNLANIFQVGLGVEFEVEGNSNLKSHRDRVHIILTCTSIKLSTKIGSEPQLLPMVVIQDDRKVPVALMANHELVALPRQVFPIEEVVSAFLAKKSDITVDIHWPEFTKKGHSVEGRILNAPSWMYGLTNPAVKRIALSVQRFGQDREGFAIIKGYVGQGVVLVPIDEEDLRVCGDLFFPLEMRPYVPHIVRICAMQNKYQLGTKWYFRACPELPNRQHKYRVYSLSSLEDDISKDNVPIEEHLSEKNAAQLIDASDTCDLIDVSDNTAQIVPSTKSILNSSNCLIDLDEKPLRVNNLHRTVPEPDLHSVISSTTLDLLSTINFNSTPLKNGTGESSLMPNPSIEAGIDNRSNPELLTACDKTTDSLEIISKLGRFHVLDENSSLSSFNFNCQEQNNEYKTEVCGCSDEDDDMYLVQQETNVKSENVEFDDAVNKISGKRTATNQVNATSKKPVNEVFGPIPVKRRDDDDESSSQDKNSEHFLSTNSSTDNSDASFTANEAQPSLSNSIQNDCVSLI
ncbi:unnamed protein product [Thelazia callipaeda]|uniref:Tudor domain-containing protein n=1 Tax=Thelazia callipaeda TaxID=103827 RepID=A0A0N5CML5_THECL|nr:unnamed protein product [Thelazia callipaeda]